MKRIKLFIHEPTINKIIGRELDISIDNKGNLVDAIKEVDRTICRRGSFPVPDYKNLLHMVYNPIKNKFYNQVAVTAYTELGQSLNVREDPKQELPEGVTVTLIPAGGCITAWEEAVDYKEFSQAMSH